MYIDYHFFLLMTMVVTNFFFFSSRRRHTRCYRDWSSDVCSSDLWQLEYVTCAKLVNYPDAASPDGSVLQPEIAAAMPTISADGLTYTFQTRNDSAFSPPASGVVTAASMKYTLERAINGTVGSPGFGFLSDIVGATEYHNGQAT